MSDVLWGIEYEKVGEEYARDCANFGEEFAKAKAQRVLRSLGFDADEIQTQLSELAA